jgi:Leucine-rich repeat (LRR) protein
MPLVNPKLFGLNVKSNLADLRDSNAALSALNIPITDLDIIRGSSNAGASIGDWISLSRLSKPIYRTLDRFYQETSIYSATLGGKAGVNFPLFGNLQINGRLSGKSIRYRYVDGSGSSATIRFADISTSRVSAWSSTASPVIDTSPIFYGARVGIVTGGSLQFGTPTSPSQVRLQTTITPRRKEFDSEFPTHKINCTIGGQNVSLYAMKGIPVIFSGNFRNLSASIGLLSPLINGIPASWKVIDADNSSIFVNYRNQGSTTSTINYSGRTQKQRFVEFYYNPNRISSINIRSANISTLPQSKFPNLTSLDLSFNSIRNFPDLNVISPLLRNLLLINNPLYLNDNTNRRRLNNEVLSLIPTSLRQLYLGGTFFGSLDLNAIGDRFSQLQILDLGRDGGAYFYPDTSSPSVPIPNVSDTCTSYSVRNNDFRTIGISSVTNANSKNVKDLTNLVSLDLSENFNLTDATFSISASNIKIQSINISGTRLPCPDLNGRQSLTVFNANTCRNIGSITTPSGTYKFDGCNSLSTLNFNDSPLTGPFPKITNSNLVSLDLRNTRITGGTPEGNTTYVIPRETFSSCGKLQTLFISSRTLLASPIHPNAFDSTVSLINVSYNSSGITSGPLPSFSACRNLRNIYFNANRFSGSVPNFAANPNITIVELSSNQFTGNVPAYRNLPLLREVNIHTNQITGFPSKFTNLPSLEFFRAHNNQISGQIPDFRDCPKLFNLILFNNQFTSYFPLSFTLLYRIRLIDLSNNLLTQQAINLIIDDLFINYNAVKRGGVVVNLRGNTLPSATALEKITFLNSKGWSIVY